MLDDDRILPNALKAWAASEPDRPFLHEVGGPSATYGGIDDRADRWAAAALRWALPAGSTVATMSTARIEWFAAWMGLARARLLEASVSTEFHGEMLSYALSKADARVLLITADLIDKLSPEILAAVKLEQIVVLDGHPPDSFQPEGMNVTTADTILSDAHPSPTENVHVEESAVLILTSGTTGPSKYVTTPWGLLYSGSLSMGPPDIIRANDVSYQPLPTSHISLRCSLHALALAGGQVVFRDRFSVRDFWHDINRYSCTNATVAAFAKLLMDQPERPDDRKSSLKTVVALPRQSAAFCDRFGVDAYGGYGLSEIGIPIIADFKACPEAVGRVRSGYPDLEIRIVDEQDRDVASGDLGELIVRSPEPGSLFSGYHNDSHATVAAWAGGWFHTGDLFRRDENGFLYFLDRRKDAIRRRNQNISSFEVEALIGKYPHVADCAAVSVPAPGEEDDLLIAVVPTDGFSFEALHDFATATMPRFMIPQYIRTVDALPKTQAMARTMKFQLRQEGVTKDTWEAPRLSRAK